MAKTYIPILSYKNKTLNALSHAASYIALVGLVVLGFTSVFAKVMQANIYETCMYIGLIAFLGGIAGIGIIWIIAKIKSGKAEKASGTGKN